MLSYIGNVDEKRVEEKTTINGEIQSVLGLEQYLSCKECHSNVVDIDSICGRCSKCDVLVKLSKCSSSMVVKVKIEDEHGQCHYATMFTKMIVAIISDGPWDGNSTAISMQLLQSKR